MRLTKEKWLQVAWSARHKTAGLTETFSRHLTHSVHSQVNLSLRRFSGTSHTVSTAKSALAFCDLSATSNSRDYLYLSQSDEMTPALKTIWFHTQTETVAKVYCRMRDRGQRSMRITWSVLVKMSSDKEKGSHHMKGSGKVIWAWTLWPAQMAPIPNLILDNNSTSLGDRKSVV